MISKTITIPYFIVLMLALSVAVAGCTQAPEQTPVVVTVINTVPVEVTRIVTVEQTVEVVREVVVTQIVEVPVTTTPTATPEATTTQPQPTETPTIFPVFTVVIATPTVPSEKTEGFAPLKVVNQTQDSFEVEISGRAYRMFHMTAQKSEIQIVPEGDYSYIVWQNERMAYQGTFRITNPDKHELHIRDGKVVFLVP